MHRQAIIALSTVSLFLGSARAEAANWRSVGRDSAGTVWYVDRDSVERSDRIVRVQVKEDGRDNRQVRWRELRSLKMIDCGKGEIMDLGTTMYDARGKPMKRISGADQGPRMDPIYPQSMGEALAEAVC